MRTMVIILEQVCAEWLDLQAFSVFVFIVECLLFPMLSRLYIIMYKKEVLV